MSSDDDNDNTVRWLRHLGWSAKQGRILTAEGKAADYYTADRGFDFDETELPHYHLMMSQMEEEKKKKKNAVDTRTVFHEWRQLQGTKWDEAPLVGAWKRTLFYGGWEHTTEHDEQVFNLQTPSLFIDLRLPTTRLRSVDRPQVTSLDDLEAHDLRRFARQHVFGGYTIIEEDGDAADKKKDESTTKQPYDLVCTRHHVMDWNFVGRPRNRPNKWHVEMHRGGQMWKEWAFATDDHGQHYYCEQWESLLPPLDSIPIVALRKTDPTSDGLLIVAGSHFNYLLDERTPRVTAMELQEAAGTSLVETVDQCLEEGNLEGAKAWLSLRGGHGQISAKDGWKVDAATEFWTEGQPLFASREDIQVVVGSSSSEDTSSDTSGSHSWNDKAHVRWKGARWDIFECNLSCAQELQELLWKGSEWASGRSCSS